MATVFSGERFRRFHELAAVGEHARLEFGREQLEHLLADQLARTDAEPPSQRLVCVLVAEVRYPPGSIPDRRQDRHAVGEGLKGRFATALGDRAKHRQPSRSPRCRGRRRPRSAERQSRRPAGARQARRARRRHRSSRGSAPKARGAGPPRATSAAGAAEGRGWVRAVRHTTGARPWRYRQSRRDQRADHAVCRTGPAHDPQARLRPLQCTTSAWPARRKVGARELDTDGLADLKPAAGDQHPPFGQVQYRRIEASELFGGPQRCR